MSVSSGGQVCYYGHLRKGEFRFMFAAVRELFDVSAEEEDRESSSSESGGSVDGGLFSAAKKQSVSLLRRATKGLAAASEVGKEALAKVLSKTTAVVDVNEEEPEDSETPAWARDCGFKVLLTGSLPLEGLVSFEPEAILFDEKVSRRVVSFLSPRKVAIATILNRTFCDAGYALPLYADLVYVGQPVVIKEAQAQRVDAVASFAGAVLVSGDKQVKAFRSDTGAFLGDTPLRDTTFVSKLVVNNGHLLSASFNGSVREWTLPHDVTRIDFRTNLCEHQGRVNDLVSAERCLNFGKGLQRQDDDSNGGGQKTPRFVSCSDDRTARIWNLTTKTCEAVLRPYSHRCATLRAACVSDAHLFLGSSDGLVYVYAADSNTRRLANKSKKLIDAIFPLDLEIDLKTDDDAENNDEEVVSAIQVSRPQDTNYDDRLFVATWCALRIYAIPGKTLDFHLLHTFRDHTDRITDLCISSNHFMTASDDHTVRFYGRYHGTYYEDAFERLLRLDGRVKCLSVEPSPAPDYSGCLVCGTSTGTVTIHPFGYSL